MRKAAFGGAQLTGGEHTRLVLRIGEVSKRSGVGIEALRFYEKGSTTAV